MSRLRLTAYALGVVGGWLPISIASGESIALRMADLETATAASYSIAIAAGWAISLATLPLAGWLSDRTARRGIDRRWWALAGLVGVLVAALLLSAATTPATLIAAWLIAQVPTAVVVAVSAARIADEVPPDLRGWASGLTGAAPVVAILLGAIVVFAVHGNAMLLFIGPAVAGVAMAIPSVLMRTRRTERGTATEGRGARLWWLLGAVALAYSGVAVGRIYLVPTIQASGVASSAVVSTATLALVIATLAAIISSLALGGVLRRAPRATRFFVIGAALLAAPLVVLALGPMSTGVLIAALALGALTGVLNASTYAIYLNSLDRRMSHGRDMGLINGAETAPYVVVPAFAAGMQAWTGSANLPLLFGLGAVAALLAAGIVLGTRLRRQAGGSG